MNDEADYRSLSLWHDTVPGSLVPRAPLVGDQDVDVAIVGAGYTGLWTAYYLKRLDPGIRVALVEAEIAGFGASGRNGGWCMGALVGMESWAADPAHREGAIGLQRAMFETVDEVGRVSEREQIDCHFAKGGTLTVATAEVHVKRLREQLAGYRALGFGEEDVRWLEPAECAQRLNTGACFGGIYLAHCAAIHPSRLARGLADVVEKQGVAIHERTPALSLEPHAIVTATGRLRAKTVVRATEAYTKSLRGHGRTILPLHSMMIATEPLPDTMWKEIGCANRETFGDARRLVVYGQRTADGRLAFGARGRYFFRSGIRDRFAADDAVFEKVRSTLVGLLPMLRDVRISHRWGGPLGVPRDWRPSLGLDRRTGLAWAGGYVGEGVAATNLAGRTLADLILERDTERCRLPWVGAASPSWEAEPLRWLAVSSLTNMAESLDTAEFTGRRVSRTRRAIFGSMVPK